MAISELFPEQIVVAEEQLSHDAHLGERTRPEFLQELRRLGWIVTEQYAFDWPGMPESARGRTPLLFADAYTRRVVELPPYTVDPLLRAALIENGAQFVTAHPTDVTKYYQGGQKGRAQGGIHVYSQHGPLLAVTSKRDAHAILDKIQDAYEGSRTDPYNEELFAAAVANVMGTGMLTARDRVPAVVVSFSGNDGRPTAAEYFPDSQTVFAPEGFLTVPVSDGRSRAGLAWADLI